MFLRHVTLVVASLFSCGANAQQRVDQLLPGSTMQFLRPDWQQDGRVVDYTLRNPVGTWVITEMTLTVVYAPPPSALPPAEPASTPSRRRPNKQGNAASPLDTLLASGWRYVPEPETFKVKVKILPDRQHVGRLELSKDNKVYEIQINEARGREPTVFDNLRNIVK